jgi:hypothetical protein
MRALLPLAILGCTTATSAAGEPRVDEAPLVIELFTSQGCSSCPPADALVNKLAKAGQLGGRAVIPLAFHVDYWDDLGWPDPFASAAWTERQREYAVALDDHVYTPELVVAGSTGMVGSQGTRVAQAIAAAPAQKKLAATATWDGKSLRVDVTAPANADVFVAIWQDSTRTKVPRGENAGETLVSDHVVRKLVRVATKGTKAQRTIEIDPAWGASGASLGAVAFAQQGDRKIVAAVALPQRR